MIDRLLNESACHRRDGSRLHHNDMGLGRMALGANPVHADRCHAHVTLVECHAEGKTETLTGTKAAMSVQLRERNRLAIRQGRSLRGLNPPKFSLHSVREEQRQ
jgi:hypothetical protein